MNVLNATEFCYVNFTSMFSLERERTQGATIVLIIKGMHLCAQIGMDNLQKELKNTGAEERDLIFTEYPWYSLNFLPCACNYTPSKKNSIKEGV